MKRVSGESSTTLFKPNTRSRCTCTAGHAAEELDDAVLVGADRRAEVRRHQHGADSSDDILGGRARLADVLPARESLDVTRNSRGDCTAAVGQSQRVLQR